MLSTQMKTNRPNKFIMAYIMKFFGEESFYFVMSDWKLNTESSAADLLEKVYCAIMFRCVINSMS